jgi:hypothetical protein
MIWGDLGKSPLSFFSYRSPHSRNTDVPWGGAVAVEAKISASFATAGRRYHKLNGGKRGRDLLALPVEEVLEEHVL